MTDPKNRLQMKVLWFSPTPSLYGKNTVRHNGGGWVASLEQILRDVPGVELGVAFEHYDKLFKSIERGVSYYPISANNQGFKKIFRKIGIENECTAILEQAKKIIKDFDPDIIHIFGSESCFGHLSCLTEVPVLIHMQGSLPAYANARFPPGYNKFDYLRACRGNPISLYRLLSNDSTFLRRAHREVGILRNCRHFMGRTEWDRVITSIYNPTATYDYCAEALRAEFVSEAPNWETKPTKEICLVSTLSGPLYKGVDLILKTAKILNEELGRKVDWKIFGVSSALLQEAKVGVKAKNLGIEFLGVASAEMVRATLLAADAYIHPSYIDNSPNSLCEAQILGVPVVATDVGGVSTLIQRDVTGYLVPANDPFMMASRIVHLKDDGNTAKLFSQESKSVARRRHDPDEIRKDLIRIYEKYRQRT
jgi:glycosyltransferase involved in cell wall biosynthesis